MRCTDGLVAKIGAEGVLAVGLEDGRGLALKVSDGYERRLLEATNLYEPFAPDESLVFPSEKLWPNPDTSAEIAELQTNIATYITQAQAEFVTGQRDINDDGAWQSYIDDLNGLGVDRYLELQQELYDAL